MALVSFTSCSKTLMASAVGRTNNLIFRRSASRRTSCITGNLPYAPLPMTSWRHFQGMFSSTERGVCPNSSRNCLDAFFLRLEISPRSITTSCSYVLPIDLDGAEGEIVKLHRRLLGKCGQALFLEVMAENADQRCSTFLLRRCGHCTSPSSYSTRDRILSKNFLHSRQKNS